MCNISTSRKNIARSAAAAFEGTPKVTEFTYDFTDNSVGILECANSPVQGVTSYSTVGLSDFPLMNGDKEYSTRLEIVGACATRSDKFANAIADAAAHVHHLRRFCAPGVIFENIVSKYYPENSTQHLLFVPPFLWEERLKTLELDDKKVAWLLAVPVTENELQYAIENGPAALEDLFVEEQIDIYDIARLSVVGESGKPISSPQ